MQEIVKIENTDMLIREYQGQRVVTFADIDKVHQRPDGTARKSFNRCKKHLILGEDYFVHLMDEAEEQFNITAPNGLITLTEQGYLMVIKPFRDDLAWQVQRQLVNVYFRVKEQYQQEQEKVIHYRTSKTLIPINDSWIKSRQEQIDRMCEMDNKTVLFAFQHIMKNLRDLFDIDEANRVFEQENGRHAENSVELINYFPQLQKAANSYLDKTEKKMIDWFKKKEEKNNDVKESNEQND